MGGVASFPGPRAVFVARRTWRAWYLFSRAWCQQGRKVVEKV